jgi:hypothetical protein
MCTCPPQFIHMHTYALTQTVTHTRGRVRAASPRPPPPHITQTHLLLRRPDNLRLPRPARNVQAARVPDTPQTARPHQRVIVQPRGAASRGVARGGVDEAPQAAPHRRCRHKV